VPREPAEQAHEGRAQAQRLDWQTSEGIEGQESIGSIARSTARPRVRTLGRSNALKSQALACGRALSTAFREPVAPSWALRVYPPLAATAARSLPRCFGTAARELMLEPTIGVTRANGFGNVRRTRSRRGHLEAGAKAELELARAEPESAETAREQRAPRGVTAGREGKALKATGILGADVARNKATRPGRDQTAERVRNPESGRCR
jgi:hypothetical protein